MHNTNMFCFKVLFDLKNHFINKILFKFIICYCYTLKCLRKQLSVHLFVELSSHSIQNVTINVQSQFQTFWKLISANMTKCNVKKTWVHYLTCKHSHLSQSDRFFFYTLAAVQQGNKLIPWSHAALWCRQTTQKLIYVHFNNCCY